ncbi:beta-propeller fold lactonase family protein [Streptococcus ratti]|uniref:3-carboxymuconate cyclase n=1 Tax=Streptococcus ratti FA-1 = DSM 20564 TaxID=699248 RepID=A0ABN0GUK7_STRRT|nr:beta-propeller fold lactonase family protein [Streptococcus ratti]EJN94146.1 3-carboxymuconate cyclase [Streptococcus ratti FA-1 = DSM 20564]EMP68940.1 3-carboxymuconate cyclase [Streptococcus ratti FA-1 = DSM 20564]QEY07970.1 lactonase family protein [Streptococcus ratti]VEI60443.1 3-carboxymuconate cyclase [Streptococcus mutans]
MIETVYFGIYTRHTPKRNYTARFDTERGTLSDLELLAAAAKENPTYLAFDRNNHLFSVSKQADRGEAASFAPDNQAHQSRLRGRRSAVPPHCRPSRSDNITIFRRDGQTGRLTEVSHSFKVPEIVCVAFKNEKE